MGTGETDELTALNGAEILLIAVVVEDEAEAEAAVGGRAALGTGSAVDVVDAVEAVFVTNAAAEEGGEAAAEANCFERNKERRI